MNHPYSSPASYIYANERPRTQPVAAPKAPYPIPTPAFPPGSHDNSWSTEGTYKVRPPYTGVGAAVAPAHPPEYSQSKPFKPRRPLPPLPPLQPLRARVAHPPQKPAVAPEPVSGWVDEEDDPESEPRTSNETMVPPASSAPYPKSKSTVIRYEGEDDPPILRPAPVPYEMRPSERALEARKHAAWRKRMIVIFCM